jgi:hypothetical protein
LAATALSTRAAGRLAIVSGSSLLLKIYKKEKTNDYIP